MRGGRFGSVQHRLVVGRQPTINKIDAKRNNNKKKSRGPLSKPAPHAVRKPFLFLTACATKYKVALYDPFRAIAPCVPTSFAVPSLKFTVWVRGTFQVGTAGVGGVAVWPFRLWANNAQAANVAITAWNYPIVTTSSTYTATDYSFTNLSGAVFGLPGVPGVAPTLGQVGWPGTNSPYSQNDFVPGTARSVRLVGSGVAVEFCDQVLTRSGEYSIWRNPGNATYLTGNYDTVGQLTALKAVSFTRVTENQVGTSYLPILAGDTAPIYEPGVNPLTPGVVTQDITSRLGYGVFIANAQAGARYNFSVIAHFEAYGPTMATTPSSSDPQGASAIQSAQGAEVMPATFPEALAVANRNLVQNSRMDGYAGVVEVAPSGAPHVLPGSDLMRDAGVAIVKKVGGALLQEGKKRVTKQMTNTLAEAAGAVAANILRSQLGGGSRGKPPKVWRAVKHAPKIVGLLK